MFLLSLSYLPFVSPTLLVVGLICVCLVFLLLVHIVHSLRSPLNDIPGPLYARFTNLPLKAAVVAGKRIHFVHALHQRYGKIVRIAPDEVAVASPQAFKIIHAVGGGFEKTEWYRSLNPVPRDGVFTMTDNKAHAGRRRLLSRPFSKSHLRQHWEPVVRERVELAVARMCAEAAKGPVDVMKWWMFMASDVSAHLMFGESFQTLEHGVVSEYMRKLQVALMGGGIGAEMPFVRYLGKRLPIQICQDLWNNNSYLMNYAEAAVKGMRANQGHANVFAGMVAEAEKAERLDDLDVKQEALNLIVAGTDTTSITLTYLVWAVLSRPELQRAVEEEVRGLPEAYQDAEVEKLELLNAVIEETLRLYGAAPGGLPRRVPSGGISMGGYFLPGGTTATTQAFSLHRDASLFPDPEEFIPARWMSSHGDGRYAVSDAARAVYSPFGAGARTCLGVHLATMELRLAAAEFFRRCAGAKLAPSMTDELMHMENYFLIAPAGHHLSVEL
ncbi:hypothetical protein BAUCODRAFT_144505 [Baudoinia panamericana UAMH 10762]|uniref:Cytochrome P450 monooxygenase n=1 Tax=Baudoinia panamericana (strain UAMH 10762) TaxID=717646 RepID=M2MVC1_BAUPA|nr:uncharacterized protein BAUCODRAFT_144505 [Baudoinia panamericana UAMH 10762]EMD00912.1 hypothetical protein BAUCODRAFT_144505 [Baudoinia panamericana UAMH 10762]